MRMLSNNFGEVLLVLIGMTVGSIVLPSSAYADPFFCVMARSGRETGSVCVPTREECRIVRATIMRQGTRVSGCRAVQRAYCYSHEESSGQYTGCAAQESHCRERLARTRTSLEQSPYRDSTSECHLEVSAASIRSFAPRPPVTGFFCASFATYNSHTQQWDPDSACFRSEPECRIFRPGLHRNLTECSSAQESYCSEVSEFTCPDYHPLRFAYRVGSMQCFFSRDHCEHWRGQVRIGMETTACVVVR